MDLRKPLLRQPHVVRRGAQVGQRIGRVLELEEDAHPWGPDLAVGDDLRCVAEYAVFVWIVKVEWIGKQRIS